MPDVLPRENVRLPMQCACGDERREKLDAQRAEAQAFLTWKPEHPVTDANFVSACIYQLYGTYGAEVEFAVDQWCGVYVTQKKYVECEHWKLKVTQDTTKEEIEAESAKCPGEPDCFVYRWDDVLKVSCECDRVEDGLAAIVLWFRDNRKEVVE